MLAGKLLQRVAAAITLASAPQVSLAGSTEFVTAADLTLEEILKTEVTTVSRKPEVLQGTAAAVFVITREDIERSGAQHIPDALRLAPGISVARIANNRWAVTARGFNGRLANKLLVLIDGRSVYSPLFSGVLWESEDTLLDDIERIEVIRGPGASLWGANAVNGVINIITRKARDSQGTVLVAGAGTHGSRFGAFRYGGESADGHFRIWAKTAEQGPSVDAEGSSGFDASRKSRAGFRRDWTLAADRRLSVSGELSHVTNGDRWYASDVSSPSGAVSQDATQKLHSGHLIARHEWASADASGSALQAYVERDVQDMPSAATLSRTTVDLDFQRHTRLNDQSDFVWGLGYRQSDDNIRSSGIFAIDPQRRRLSLFSGFVQNELSLPSHDLRLILGARIEKNSFTGWEPQPNARLVWSPTPSQALWSALSRAARTPSRAENDAQIDIAVRPASPPAQPLPVLLRNVASPPGSFTSELADTFELGYRRQFGSDLWLDVAAFHSEYQRLRSARLVSQSVVAGPTPYVLQEVTVNNGLSATTRGIEASLEWQPAAWWRIQSSYAHIQIKGRSTTDDPININDAGNLGATTPSHQASIRSVMNLSGGRQWDLWWRHTASIPSITAFGAPVPVAKFSELDMRFAWRPLPSMELSIVGQNLLKSRHLEFVPDFIPSPPLQVQRSVYLKLRVQH